MEKNSNTPEIRFRGCQGAWEHRKAASIFGVVSDKGHADLPILSASQELGMIHRDENGINMNYSQANVAGYKRVQPGEFVIHLRSFQGGFAHSSIEGITSPAYTILDFKDQDFHCDLYWKHVLVSEQFIKRLESITYGIRDGKSIKYEEFGGMAFAFPSRDEQERIAECFEKIDALVSRQREKVERLRKLKAALLDKLFPKPGHTAPELRVNGCTGEWEEKKLSEIVSPYSECVPTPKNGYARLGIRSHGKGTFHSYVAKGEELETAQMSVVRADMLIMNITFAWELAVAITTQEDAGKLVSHRFPQYAFNDEMEPPFFRYALINDKFRRHLYLASPGSAGRNRVLKTEQMLEYTILIPSTRSEQLAISSLLMKYDRLTSLHEAKLAKLRQLKLSLLDKMFV